MPRCQTRRLELITIPKVRGHPLIAIEVSGLLISSPDFRILFLGNLGLVPSCNQSGSSVICDLVHDAHEDESGNTHSNQDHGDDKGGFV